MTSFSEPVLRVRRGDSRRTASDSKSSNPSTGAEYASMSVPSKALLRNAELVHIFTKDAKAFGISGEVADYGIAYDRSRKVAEGRVAGAGLMKKNKITEIHGYGMPTPNVVG